MREKLQKIRETAIAEIEKSEGLEKLNDVRQTILGKKGELTAVLKGMKDVAPEDRPKVGQKDFLNKCIKKVHLIQMLEVRLEQKD